MKRIIIPAALLASTTIASAQPSLTESAPAPTSDEHAYYVQAGAELGGAQGAVFLAPTIEAGVRLGSGPLWAHGMILSGGAGEIDEANTTGTILQVRGGVEARTCSASRIACASAGIDVGYSHAQVMAEDWTDKWSGGMLIPRVGLDVGGDHLRVRPGVEVGFDSKGWNQLGLTAAVAYQW